MMDVFDCGARGGPHRSWQNFGAPIRYTAFEPEPEENTRLMDNGSYFKIAPFALGAKDESRQLNIYKSGDLSSFYKFNGKATYRYDNNIEPISSIDLPCVTIESYAVKEALVPKFLNIDAQGASLEILEGAGEYLSGMLGLRCEAELVDVYLDAPKFGDVLSFMHEKGYRLIRIETCGPGKFGPSTDMNEWSRSSNDALPMWGDAVFENTRYIEQILAKETKSQLELIELTYLALFVIHNGCGYRALDLLDSFDDFMGNWIKNLPDELCEEFSLQVKCYLDQPMHRRKDVPGQNGYGRYADWLNAKNAEELSQEIKTKIRNVYAADRPE